RSKIPYAPTRRLTPAGSVLVPLTPAEMERYRNYPGGAGTLILRKKRRREGEGILGSGSDPRRERDDDDEARGTKRRRVGDVGIVVEHYNARPEVGVTQRQESPIIGLKSFNNWVKSVLITRFAHPAFAASPTSGARSGGGGKGKVLDMGCGKGGDLTKWAKARIKEYVGLDIAAVSVDQARQRHEQLRGPRFTAAFLALDCYAHSLSSALPPALLVPPFDVVSMQFCMHYAFESEEKARCMLENVSTWLREGGIFIGTIPNAEQLLDRMDSLPPDETDLSFGNNVYKIRFESRTQRPIYGQRYWFYLQDAVDDVPEYIVHWDNFLKLAAEYRLHLTYKKEFHELFEEHHTHSEFGPLLERMRVVDANGESQMDEDQWEAASEFDS
ncbi:guanine-N(7)-methyltransferase, partial [Obba rivulosa]